MLIRGVALYKVWRKDATFARGIYRKLFPKGSASASAHFAFTEEIGDFALGGFH
ncbi:hypothetical protein TUM17567_28260 [Citrobacter amalonaticus]|nr:hypothetical protein TUM17567_28260 [Citrobacter amalonaticus]